MRERPILFSGLMVRAILEGRKAVTRRIVKPQPAIGLDGFSGIAHNVRGSMWRGGLPTLNLCRCGRVGDRLWVRETWAEFYASSRGAIHEAGIRYAADGKERVICVAEPRYGGNLRADGKLAWHPSIHMPRWASRLTLEITDVRVQRLQNISEDDALAEGCNAAPWEQWYEGQKPMADGSSVRQQSRGLPPDNWTAVEKLDSDYDPLATTAKQEFQKLWDSINGKRASWQSNPWVWALSFRRLS